MNAIAGIFMTATTVKCMCVATNKRIDWQLIGIFAMVYMMILGTMEEYYVLTDAFQDWGALCRGGLWPR